MTRGQQIRRLGALAILVIGGGVFWLSPMGRLLIEGPLLDPASRQPKEGVLRAEQNHRFLLPLETDQFLQFLVDQQGIDVEVILYEPRGQQLLKIDNPSGADGIRGPERVFWVAEASGIYTVEVRGWFSEGPSGAYTRAIEALRPATEVDRQRVAAEKAVAEGDGFKEAEDYPQATERFDTALATFLALGDTARTADVHFRLGETWRLREEGEAAQEAYTQALDLYRDLGNRRQQAISTYFLGYLLYYYRSDPARARDALAEAQSLFEAESDRSGMALVNNQMGILYRQWGEGKNAIAAYDKAVEIWQDQGEEQRFKLAIALNNRGQLHASLGQKEAALADLEAALKIQAGSKDKIKIAGAQNAKGEIHLKFGDLEKALNPFERALNNLQEAPKAKDLKARILTNIARVHLARKNWREAHDRFREALAMLGGEPSPSEAWALQGLGSTQLGLGDPGQALKYFHRAHELFAKQGFFAAESEALFHQARAQRDLEDPMGARRTIQEVVKRCEDIRAKVGDSSGLRASFFATQQKYYDFYIDLLMELHRSDPDAGHDRAALWANEQARARSLLELLTATGGNLERNADPALREEKQDLERRINFLEEQIRALSATPTDAGRLALEETRTNQADLRQDLALVDEHIATAPEYRAWDQTLTAEDVQRQLLDDDTLLLAYRLGEPRSFLWAVTREDFRSFVLPAREEIERSATQGVTGLYKEADSTTEATEGHLRDLSDWLLRPVQDLLPTKPRLLILADGALQSLPFATLPIPQPLGVESQSPLRLIEQHEIITAHSASVLATIREQAAYRPPVRNTLAVIADPVFNETDGRLTGKAVVTASATRAADLIHRERLASTGSEAKAILEFVFPGQGYQAIGFEASTALVKSGVLSPYQIVHFATHALLVPDNPAASHLLLSRFDAEGNYRGSGELRVSDIHDLELSADLVVLSACESALGREIRGEGLWGLTQAFLDAGASQLVVTLWSVDDARTAELMERFYKHLLEDHLPPSVALQKTQAYFHRQPNWPPKFWAAFVLQGDWASFSKIGINN